MIDPTLRDPAWLQLGKVIRDRISSGVYEPGHRIATETELMAEFEVGRSTARKAVGWLRDQGLVETEAKRGTYVVEG